MRENLRDVFCKKTGTNYIILRIPKELFDKFPESSFIDLEIKDVRDSKPDGKKYVKRK